MSQQMSRQIELGIHPAIVAMGAVVPAALTSEPWKGPNMIRLGAAHSYQLHKLPPEYKVDLTS
jgi:hypothetical protein